MKRRSANQQAAGVSLFPFLAVLLCTMGAMIIVLVVIARHTRVKVAEAARAEAAAGQAGELAAESEELAWKIDELKKSREGTQKLLADKQTELSHLEEHARRLKDQLEESAAARAHFSELAAGDARENEDLRKRLARARIDLDRTRAEVEELKRKGGGPGESYAIIPYHGPNETHRRPIYIECRQGKIILQPEGVELSVDEDFTVDLGPSNPLASALRAVADYHNRMALAGKGGGGTPYPLFIIRPDGINTWHVAREAVSSWGADFGYELVGQDWKFDFPPPDARLTVAVREAVAEAKVRQALIAQAAPRLTRSGGHAVFRASQQGGITQVEGSPNGGGHRGRGRPGLGSRRGGLRGNGLGSGPGPAGGGGMGPDGTPPRLLATSPQRMGDGPVHSIDGDDNPYASALEGTGTGNGSGPPGFGGNGGPGTAPGIGGTGGGRYAGTPGTGAAGTGYGPGGQPGAGLGQPPGSGQGSGQGLAERGGYGQQTGAGQPGGAGSGQSGLRGSAGVPGGSPSGTGGSPSGNLLAMGGPNPSGSRYGGGGSGGNGIGGNGTSGNATAGNGTGDGQQGGSDLMGQAQGGASPDGTQPGTGLGGTQPRGQGARGTVAGGTGTGGQSAGQGTSGEPLVGPNRPAGGGNAQQVSGQAEPGIGVPGNARVRANGTGKSRYASGPTGSGTSDPNATDDQGQGTAGGPNVAASPNGVAGATVINNGTTISESAAGASTRYGSAGGQSDSGSATNSAGGAQQPGGRGSVSRLGNSGGPNANPTGQQLASQNSSSGSGGPSSAMSGQQSSSAGGGSSSMMQSMQGGMPSPNFNYGQQDQSQQEQRHKRHREKNWANPDASTSNVPIQRPIRIVCDSDHLTLLPEGRGKQGMRVIPLKERTAESMDDLVSTVWDRIDSWGTAGRSMYWRPTLVMEVEPGAEKRYAELQALLADSGFDVHGKPRTRGLFGPRAVGRAR